MKKYSPEESLDEVLRFLEKDYYSHHIDFSDLQSQLPHQSYIDTGLLLLLERLDEDKFIDRRYSGSCKTGHGICKITHKGIQFIRSGGYINQAKIESNKERRNRLIYIWSVIAGIASVIGLIIALIK